MPLLSITLVSGEAQAQQQYSNAQHAQPRIDGFNVDEVKRLIPGTDLNFTVYGTPGGTATLRIGGARRNLTLNEVESGQYEGTYTISSRESINAKSAVTANLRVGNQVTTAVLSESLQAGVGYHGPASRTNAMAPKIERFDVRQSADLSGGNDLAFILNGTPGGKAEIEINGARGKFFLDEMKSGEYSGTYTIKNRDRIASNSIVNANLRVGDRITTVRLGKALQLAAAPVAAPAVRVVKYCTNCGTVEAVNLIEVKGDGSYLGTIGGGVVGALLGSQVGGGNGRTAAELAGAIGGAYAGRAVEQNAKRSSHFEVLVRLQNGGTQIATYAADPGYKVGDKVKMIDGNLVHDL